MKLMFASDIHGSAYFCEKMLEAFSREAPRKLVLLGDILYHGPRNDLPRDYAPKRVIELLNPLAARLLCVRGNCDAEVDQMVLKFPIKSEYAAIFADNYTFYAVHGHQLSEDALPPMQPNTALVCGHTHIPRVIAAAEGFYFNTGSVSIPKNGSPNSFLVYENGALEWKTLDGEVFDRFSLISPEKAL